MFEKIIRLQTAELAEIRSLARAVSRKTGRVVLSLHNASLAAVGGWGFEFLDRSFPCRSQWLSFVEATGGDSLPEEVRPSAHEATVNALWQLWEERIVKPQLVHALWQGRVEATLNPFLAKPSGGDQEGAASEPAILCPLSGVSGNSWRGLAVSPHQRRTVGEILEWRKERARLWQWGYNRLAAFIREGQKLLSSGALPCFVIPWIDKFFISSRRDQDSAYLLLLLQWLGHLEPKPVVLFWEDTGRLTEPSFKLALQRMTRVRPALRGIGIYDTGYSSRQDALKIICNSHDATELFALRPFSDAHNPVGLKQVLRSLDHRLLRPYDSSWKDNLTFLYTGTQIRALLSVQCEEEEFSPWVAVEREKMLFGAYLRARLREGVLGSEAAACEPLALRFASWAHLL